MFGKVKPFVPELKIKDHVLFKQYYCSLCKSIKLNFGNFPRFFISYDMTFLAILLDSLNSEINLSKNCFCIMHPRGGRASILNNDVIDYCAFSNVYLTYFKILDDIKDDNKALSKFLNVIYKRYIRKNKWNLNIDHIKNQLSLLSYYEGCKDDLNLDIISHPFSDIVGYIASQYFKGCLFEAKLYDLGYALGKWIYIVDAYEDLKEDIKENNFNPIHSIFNKSNLRYEEFVLEINERIQFTLINLSKDLRQNLLKLPLKKNTEILDNIVSFGLMDKLSVLFKEWDYGQKPL